MTVAVCVPFRPRHPLWVENLATIRKPFEELGWPIYIGDHGGDPFCRGTAINNAADLAIEDCDPDVLFVSDADHFHPNTPELRNAARVARKGDCYVVAYTRMHVLSMKGSEQARAGKPGKWDMIETVSRIWGGQFAIGRPLWERTCGFDERFVGYGSEDLGFLPVANTLGAKPKQRIEGDVYHLSHPTSTERDNMGENSWLAQQYRGVDGDLEAMRALLTERGC